MSLETLAVLPMALEEYSALNALLLLVGLPLVAIVLISLLVMKGSLRTATRDPDGKYSDPTWMGASGELQQVGDKTGTGALPGRTAPGQPTAQDAEDKGGASARW